MDVLPAPRDTPHCRPLLQLPSGRCQGRFQAIKGSWLPGSEGAPSLRQCPCQPQPAWGTAHTPSPSGGLFLWTQLPVVPLAPSTGKSIFRLLWAVLGVGQKEVWAWGLDGGGWGKSSTSLKEFVLCKVSAAKASPGEECGGTWLPTRERRMCFPRGL